MRILDYTLQQRSDLGCVLLRWRGRFNLADMARHAAETGDCPMLDSGLSLFCDLRDVDMSVSPREVIAVSRLSAPAVVWSGRRKVALLAGSEFSYGMQRIVATVLEGPHLTFNVCRSVPEAASWLGLPADIGDPFTTVPLPADATAPAMLSAGMA